MNSLNTSSSNSNFSNAPFSSIQECRTALDTRTLSTIELAEYFFKRIEQHNTNINAFLDINWESTKNQAIIAQNILDEHHKNNTVPHILTGIPIAHKDVFVTKGWKTTAASKMLEHYKSPFDAHIVENFLKVHTVCLGKLNMDEFAMGSTNENSAFGAVKNPWHLNSVAGGSSGGSAAAVAGNLIPFATGSDTGGSIRQPAAYCGITGLKPTYGSSSRYGMIAYASSLDQAGVMAKSSHDVAVLLNTLIGFDERDSTSLQRVYDDYTSLLNQPLSGKKIGIPVEFLNESLQAEIGIHIDEVCQILEKLGAEIIKINLPRPELSIPAYYVLASAEASTNLSRYDGVRYGYRADESNIASLDDLYRKSRSEGFGEEVKRRILTGAYVLSQGFYDAYYRQAGRVRQQIYLDYQHALSLCDVILSPTAPTTAPLLNSQNKDPMMMYLADIYTLGTNLAGLPALSFPVGFDNEKKPIGLQLIGKAHREPLLLNVAHQFQQVNKVHLQMPNL